jgi:hypothetical protein
VSERGGEERGREILIYLSPKMRPYCFNLTQCSRQEVLRSIIQRYTYCKQINIVQEITYIESVQSHPQSLNIQRKVWREREEEKGEWLGEVGVN